MSWMILTLGGIMTMVVAGIGFVALYASIFDSDHEFANRRTGRGRCLAGSIIMIILAMILAAFTRWLAS